MINEFFQHTRIRNCLHLFPNRPVTGMTGWAALPHNENEWHGVKNGRLFERSEFRPFSHDRHSQRNGSFGRPPFAMPKRFARNQRFRLSAYLGSFFFGGTKKNEHLRVQGHFPAFFPHNKNKKITAIQTAMWRNKNTLHCLYGCRISTQIHQKGSYDISDAGVIPTI